MGLSNAWVPAYALVDNPALPLLNRDAREVIRQLVGPSGQPHRRAFRRVETEEPDPRLSARGHIGSDIDLCKGREPGQPGYEPRPNTGHVKRHHTNPRLPVMGVDLKRRRNQGSQKSHVDGPVHEQQIMPAHGHNPGAARHCPGTTIRFRDHDFDRPACGIGALLALRSAYHETYGRNHRAFTSGRQSSAPRRYSHKTGCGTKPHG